jgi:hypothetical protein
VAVSEGDGLLTYAYELAVKSLTGELYKGELDSPATIRWEYDDSEVEGLDEESIIPAFWSIAQGRWVELQNIVRDTAYNSLVGETNHFSSFGSFSPPADVAETVKLTDVTISGDETGVVDTEYEFTANVSPISTTPPITYTWEAMDQNDVVTSTTAVSHTVTFSWTTTGARVITVTADNVYGQDVATHTIDIGEVAPCVPVTDVVLSRTPTGNVDTVTEVEFSADIAPDNAGKPYTYTIDYGAGAGTPAASSADPLTLTHTFVSTGTYIVEVAVWNCTMVVTNAVTDTVQVVVEEPVYNIYLPLVLRNT